MYIIGDKTLFAYQWQLIDHEATFYWGNFCFFIGGLEVGDFNQLTTLSISLNNLRSFLKQGEKRFYARSEIVPKNELF